MRLLRKWVIVLIDFLVLWGAELASFVLMVSFTVAIRLQSSLCAFARRS